MKKNIAYYLGLPYTRELIPEPSGIWFSRIKELPYCMSQGNSPEEALHNLDEAMCLWLEGELEDGEAIPEPREEEEYSGKFNTRVPKSLHRKLVDAADREGVSLNQWIATALAEALGGTPGTSSNPAWLLAEVLSPLTAKINNLQEQLSLLITRQDIYPSVISNSGTDQTIIEEYEEQITKKVTRREIRPMLLSGPQYLGGDRPLNVTDDFKRMPQKSSKKLDTHG